MIVDLFALMLSGFWRFLGSLFLISAFGWAAYRVLYGLALVVHGPERK